MDNFLICMLFSSLFCFLINKQNKINANRENALYKIIGKLSNKIPELSKQLEEIRAEFERTKNIINKIKGEINNERN